jgi:3-isopropylmalate/(R)-2-methylmalate dehydratase large subunit
MVKRTLYDKLWDSHTVRTYADGTSLLYIDRHLIQEVSSPQAFEGLRATRRSVRRPDTHLAVVDHAVPTTDRTAQIADPLARAQINKLSENTAEFGIKSIPLDDPGQGIVHVIGPELGFTLPGITLVCGDSHTSTHGAFGALAFGIGASECECVLATQTLRQTRSKNLRITLNGSFSQWVSAKDAILAIIDRIGAAGASGHAMEYQGDAVTNMSMEARMTLCNMAIEAGARVGLVAPDDTTLTYVKDRPYAPTGPDWDRAVDAWQGLHSDPDAVFDREEEINLSTLVPYVTWGTSPQYGRPITGNVPKYEDMRDDMERDSLSNILDYMGLEEGTPLEGIKIDRVFVGSCTNGRIEDLRAAAAIVGSHKVADSVEAIVVPGSGAVKRMAEAEGLDKIFNTAGFQWREPGCSMCVAMNPDRLNPAERCASTSNRNFEGRQGPGGRTHLLSPVMAVAAAIKGHLTDARKLSR